MWMNEYQALAKRTAVYPDQGKMLGMLYAVIGLADEVGEVAGKVKRALRDDGGVLTEARREELLAELGDVLWYVAMLADEVGSPLAQVAAMNIAKLAGRAAVGTIHGEGDKR